jgi:phosphatidylserine/phosphatidylglycerophosphate/cardiolipin synthase-like enzyme
MTGSGRGARRAAALGAALSLAWPAAALPDRLILKDGSTLDGHIINATGSLIVIRLDTGETRPIPRRSVAGYRGAREAAGPRAGSIAGAHPAEEVLLLSGRRYRAQLVDEIARAERRVFVIIYEMCLGFWKGNEPLGIADALIEAQARGVDVRILFEDPGSGFILDCNVAAARYLAAKGVAVRFDDPRRVTHTKLVVIDGETSILGSHNWSLSGLRRNSESSVLLRSKGAAAEYERCFAEAWAGGNAPTGAAVRLRRETTRRR